MRYSSCYIVAPDVGWHLIQHMAGPGCSRACLSLSWRPVPHRSGSCGTCSSTRIRVNGIVGTAKRSSNVSHSLPSMSCVAAMRRVSANLAQFMNGQHCDDEGRTGAFWVYMHIGAGDRRACMWLRLGCKMPSEVRRQC